MKFTKEQEEQFLKEHGHTIAEDRFYASSDIPKTEMNCLTCKHANRTKVIAGIYCEFYKEDTGFLPIGIDCWNCEKYIKA